MALGSTQPLVKMSTRNIPGGKGGRCIRLTTYHHYSDVVKKSRSLNFLDSSGPAWPVTGVLYLYPDDGRQMIIRNISTRCYIPGDSDHHSHRHYNL